MLITTNFCLKLPIMTAGYRNWGRYRSDSAFSMQSNFPPIAGHPGQRRIYDTMRKIFFWKHMANFVYHFVRNCAACARSRKSVKRKWRGPTPSVGTSRNYFYRYTLPTAASVIKKHIFIVIWTATRSFQGQSLRWRRQLGIQRPCFLIIKVHGTENPALAFHTAALNPWVNCSRLLGILSQWGTDYHSVHHPQAIGPVEKCEKKIVMCSQPLVPDYKDDCDIFVYTLTYACHTQVHRSIRVSQFCVASTRHLLERQRCTFRPWYHLQYPATNLSAYCKIFYWKNWPSWEKIVTMDWPRRKGNVSMITKKSVKRTFVLTTNELAFVDGPCPAVKTSNSKNLDKPTDNERMTRINKSFRIISAPQHMLTLDENSVSITIAIYQAACESRENTNANVGRERNSIEGEEASVNT